MKIALVTGAGKRIGQGLALFMLEAGYHVILHANASLPEIQAWVERHPRKAQVLATIGADFTRATDQEYLCTEIKKIVRHLDVVVNNASLYSPVPFESVDREQFRNMQAVNLEAPFFITQSLLPLLKRSKNPSVINIVDALWERPSPQFAHYAVSKAGLAVLTHALARELAPLIRVNAVAPGAILFPSFLKEEQRQKIIEKIPLKRLGTINDIGNAVIYLSEKALSSTGTILMVDGGRSLTS